MSEATGGERAQMKRRLIERSLQDDAFRQRLLEDPKGTIEQELGTLVPEEVQILAVEETQDTIYLVLPPPPRRSTGARSPTGTLRRWPEVKRVPVPTRLAPVGCVSEGLAAGGAPLRRCVIFSRYRG